MKAKEILQELELELKPDYHFPLKGVLLALKKRFPENPVVYFDGELKKNEAMKNIKALLYDTPSYPEIQEPAFTFEIDGKYVRLEPSNKAAEKLKGQYFYAWYMDKRKTRKISEVFLADHPMMRAKHIIDQLPANASLDEILEIMEKYPDNPFFYIDWSEYGIEGLGMNKAAKDLKRVKVIFEDQILIEKPEFDFKELLNEYNIPVLEAKNKSAQSLVGSWVEYEGPYGSIINGFIADYPIVYDDENIIDLETETKS